MTKIEPDTRAGHTVPKVDANSATILLDKAAQALPTRWSAGPGFALFYARMMAKRHPEPVVFVAGPLL